MPAAESRVSTTAEALRFFSARDADRRQYMKTPSPAAIKDAIAASVASVLAAVSALHSTQPSLVFAQPCSHDPQMTPALP